MVGGPNLGLFSYRNKMVNLCLDIALLPSSLHSLCFPLPMQFLFALVRIKVLDLFLVRCKIHTFASFDPQTLKAVTFLRARPSSLQSIYTNLQQLLYINIILGYFTSPYELDDLILKINRREKQRLNPELPVVMPVT